MKNIFILISILVLFGCKEEKRNVWSEGVEFETSFDDKPEPSVDRIPERNNPNAINLFEQALFIDTTGQSSFYKEVQDWEEEPMDRNRIAEEVSAMEEEFELLEMDFQDVPIDWIILRQYKDDYLLVNLRPGVKGERYRIADKSVSFYNQGNTQTIHGISAINKWEPDHIELGLIAPSDHSEETRTAVFSIRPTKTPFVYLLKCVYDHTITYELVTPLNEIHNFEMMVWNNKGLVFVPVDFDPIDYEKIETELEI